MSYEWNPEKKKLWKVEFIAKYGGVFRYAEDVYLLQCRSIYKLMFNFDQFISKCLNV